MIRILPVVVILVVSACSRGTPADAKTTSAVQATAANTQAAGQAAAAVQSEKPVPAQLPDVIARVNGDAISRSEFEGALSSIEGRAGGPVPADQRDRVYRGILDQLIGYRLLTQEAAARKVAVPDADVDKRMADIRQQFPTEEAFRQTLEQRQLTVEKLRTETRSELTVEKMLEDELASKVAVKPEQVTDFYQKNPDKFQQGERVRASHILIPFPPKADAAAKQQAQAKATEVLAEVKSGKDFAALAKQYSQDPGSGPNGGDLGFFQKGQMVGPFENTAFSLKPGEISELVETQFGFHIIKVTEKQTSRTVPIDEVRPQIEEFLEGQNRQEQARLFVEALKARGKVEIFI
jgi:peptidyl-prolyl cis-trans isomerase C